MDRLERIKQANMDMEAMAYVREAQRRAQGEHMAKVMPIESTGEQQERLPWEHKPYPFVLKEVRELPNKFYSPHRKCKSCKTRCEDDKATKCPKCGHDAFWPGDDEIDKEQFQFVWECLDGEKNGDWLWTFAAKSWGVKSDGSTWGKLPAIAEAMGVDYMSGIDPEADLVGGYIMGMVKPKKEDPKYGGFETMYRMDAEQIAKYKLAADVTVKPDDEEDIPFSGAASN